MREKNHLTLPPSQAAEAKQGAVKELAGKLTKMALVGASPDKIMEIVKDFTVTVGREEGREGGREEAREERGREGGRGGHKKELWPRTRKRDYAPDRPAEVDFFFRFNRHAPYTHSALHPSSLPPSLPPSQGATDDPTLASVLQDLQKTGNAFAMEEIQEKFLQRVLGEEEGGKGLTMASFYDTTWLRKVKEEMVGNKVFWQILGEEEGAYFKKKLMLEGGEEGEGYVHLKPSEMPDPETLLGKW